MSKRMAIAANGKATFLFTTNFASLIGMLSVTEVDSFTSPMLG